MRILTCGNCQASGIAYFLRRALPTWEIHDLPHLASHYGEFTQDHIATEHEWADIVLFHHKHDHPQNYPTKQPKIPLSVWFQSAPFMAHVPGELWADFKRQGGTPETAVHHDFDYQSRWDVCVERMKQKEKDEDVPREIRMSGFMDYGRQSQLQLTCNHPTSLVFWWWVGMLCKFIGHKPSDDFESIYALDNLNMAGLPCEESATTGARGALGLSWGGRPEDNESGLQIARERLALL